MAYLSVSMVKGGSPTAWEGVNRSAINATRMWSLQCESGYFKSSFRRTSLMDRIVLSAYPLALLLPTVINRCLIPKA